ncbi:hypothetical protein [Marinifilum sp. D737]|uniref:hypothetical protein n=1 Tax=Marinifilum sp. D737 TaxID=2969628 RepID=UPI0022741A6F|nr:hypothetical protein [Marinifilum sp. D737]MCY1635354.1 DUF3857 domain-containing protein [Marinifilum sp. D737]
MKNIILLGLALISMVGMSYGQTDSLRAEQLRNQFWENRSEQWTKTDIPEKWKDESAVILNKETYYWVKKTPLFSSLEERYHTHKRIKVIDDKAIESYSEFSFAESQQYYSLFWGSSNLHYYFGIKVIKVDGSEEIVGESDKIHTQVKHRNRKVGYQKIAIPNLEKGDVIDYYYCMERRFPMDQFYMFDPVRYFLNDNHPIVRQELTLEIARKCYLNCRSVNDAPFMKEIDTDVSKAVKYHLIDEGREKFENEILAFPYSELPCIKFQAFFPGGAFSYSVPYADFLGERLKMKNTAYPQGLAKLAKSVNTAGAGTFYPVLKKYIISKYGKEKPENVEKLVHDIYFFLREYWCQQQFFVKNQRTNYYNWFTMYSTVGGISRILKMYEIKHDLLYIMPKYIGEVDDLLFLDELSLGLHVKGEEHPILITKINPYSLPSEIPHLLSEVKAYAVPSIGENPVVSTYTFPKLKSENEENIVSKLKFDSENETLRIESEFTISGTSKLEWDTLVMTNKVFFDEFKADQYSKFIKDRDKGRKLEQLRAFNEKLRVRFADEEKKRTESLEKYLQELYGIQNCNVVDFNLISSGRWTDSSSLNFKVVWESSSYVSQFGERSLLSVGRFMKKPLGEEFLQKDRMLDVHFKNKEAMLYKLELELPEGFDVKGIKELKNNWEDDYFYIKSDNEKQANKVIIQFEVGIKNSHLPVEEWGKVRNFFAKISNLYEKQIVIQKKQDNIVTQE